MAFRDQAVGVESMDSHAVVEEGGLLSATFSFENARGQHAIVSL